MTIDERGGRHYTDFYQLFEDYTELYNESVKVNDQICGLCNHFRTVLGKCLYTELPEAKKVESILMPIMEKLNSVRGCFGYEGSVFFNLEEKEIKK